MAASLRRIETVANQLQYSMRAERTKSDYEVIIVGGGIHGTATAYALAKKGKKVLLLEQFDVNHDQGSSHGDGRIVRYTYPEPVYIEMAKLGYPLWDEIQKLTGQKLIHTTGGILFSEPNDPDTIDLVNNLTAGGIPFDDMSAEEATRKYPMFKFPAGSRVIYQKDSGVAFASKAVKALWDAAKGLGVTVMAKEKVVSLQVVNEHQVAVKTESGKRFTGEKVVVTAGAWAKDLLSQLNLDIPLVVTEEEVFYWSDKHGSQQHSMHNMPIFIVHGQTQFYGLPQIDIPGVKIGWHHSGTDLDIKTRQRIGEYKQKEKVVSNFVKEVFPNLSPETPSHKLTCLYTTTPDHHFILDYHPTYKNVIVGSPCSGHGFKFGPIIGEILARMATGEKLPMPINEFKLSRFSEKVVKRGGV